MADVPLSTTPAVACPSARASRIGRFRLDDLISQDATGSRWKGTDERLRRAVDIQIVLATDPQLKVIRQAACAAARVDDRRVVRVLDVLDVEGALAIVSEWVEAITLPEALAAPLPVPRAVRIATEVAEAVAAIHQSGCWHGRLEPSQVLLNSDGKIKLRGHLVNASRSGIATDGATPMNADIFGIGAVLMACLTTHWPLAPKDGLLAVPLLGGVTATPNSLIADIPSAVNQVVMRCFAAITDHRIPVGHVPYPTVAAAAQALALVQLESISANAGAGSKTLRRVWSVLAGVGIAAAISAVGAGLVIISMSSTGQSPERVAAAWHPPPSIVPTPGVQLLPAEKRVRIKKIWPLAGKVANSSEFPTKTIELISITDGDPGTFWRTARYKSADSAAAAPSGIAIDLGAEAAIKQIELALLGDGSDLTLAAASKPPTSRPRDGLLAVLEGAAPNTTVRLPRPTSARYLVIWFTRVPQISGEYRGGIADIKISAIL